MKKLYVYDPNMSLPMLMNIREEANGFMDIKTICQIILILISI